MPMQASANAMLDIRAGINFCALNPFDRPTYLPSGPYQPGFLTVLAAHAARNRIPCDRILMRQQSRGYLQTIGLYPALGGPDSYAYDRKNAGKNYSLLTPLRDEGAVDIATTSVNGCVRSMLEEVMQRDFLDYLCKVIGELHDNIWSHGKSPGFSLAQRYLQRNGSLLEFSVADAGIGFSREMARVGHQVESDEAAILWCIERGNTTKGTPNDDGWAQALPGDAIGNPYGDAVRTRIAGNDNHHQGLGLYHLTELVRRFSGELLLASGTHLLQQSPKGRTIVPLPLPWQGVALCCRFHTADVGRNENAVELDAETAAILNSLKEMAS